MAADDTDGRRPSAPAVLRIKLRYNSVEAMVSRFAPNVGKSGIFLPTRSIHPPGTEIKFELRLATDVPMLVGLGRVASSHEPDPNNSRAVFGIAVEIIRVTREGRQLLVRLIERRRAMGLADVAIPIPADIDAARRADIDTQPRAQIPTPGVSLLGSGNVLTAPRPSPVPLESGHTTAQRGARLTLPPEPARRPRPRVSDLIRAASPAATQTDDPANLLGHNIDVEEALTRARALAGGDLDNELAQLRDTSAAPLAEIEVEEASAELARHLGGVAVKRDRSAPVAVPGAAWTPRVFPRGITVVEDATGGSSHTSRSPDEAPLSESDVESPARRVEPPSTFEPQPPVESDKAAADLLGSVEPQPPVESDEAAADLLGSVEPQPPVESDEAAADLLGSVEPQPPVEFDEAAADPLGSVESQPPVEFDEAAADPLGSVESVQAATESSLERGTIAQHSFAASPLSAEVPGATDEPVKLPQQDVDSGESPHMEATHGDAVVASTVEDEDSDVLSFERALDAARIQTGVTHTPAPPASPADEDSGAEDDEIVDELDDAELEQLRVITPPAGVAVSANPIMYPDATAIPDLGERAPSPPSPMLHPDEATNPRNGEGEEVSDVDVLAEASEEDDDLLHAHLRRDELGQSSPPQATSAPEFLDPAELVEPRIGRGTPVGEPVVHSPIAAPALAVPAVRDEEYAHSAEAHYEEAHYEEAHYEQAYDDDAHAPYPAARLGRAETSDHDFASRLDLDDDDGAGHSEDADSYTFADRISAINLVNPAATFEDPYGLEDALSNLDEESNEGVRRTADSAGDRRRPLDTRRPPLPGMPTELNHDPFGTAQTPRPKRFVTDDGVVIDFDDDES